MDYYVIVISYACQNARGVNPNDVTKPELVCEFEGSKLQYVIDNASIQLSRMMKYAYDHYKPDSKERHPIVTMFRTDRSTRIATQAYLKEKWYNSLHHAGDKIADRVALLDIARSDLGLSDVEYNTIYSEFVYKNNNGGKRSNDYRFRDSSY